MTGMVDISLLITLHREGPLAHRTLCSAMRCCEIAVAQGLSVEMVVTLDKADEQTFAVAKAHPFVRAVASRILLLAHGDLSSSRNSGIEASRGSLVTVCDGDDHLSPNWLVAAHRAQQDFGADAILHPEVIATFGTESVFWFQPDQIDAGISPVSMLAANPWNACCFAPKRIFEAVPYEVSRPGESGFGFEDWHWNCQTMADGFVHRIVPQTVRFERRKLSGSLNQAHRSASSLVRRSRLFDPQVSKF
jgi:hypothetical protein